jgi:hypothetical protein
MPTTPTSFRLDANALADIDELARLMSERDAVLIEQWPESIRSPYSRTEAVVVAVRHYLDQLRAAAQKGYRR